MTLTVRQTCDAWIVYGQARHAGGPFVHFVKAFVGGVLLSLGGLLYLIVGGGDSLTFTTPYPGLNKLITALLFPIGLIMISLQGADLVTSNMGIYVMTTLTRKTPWWSYFTCMLLSTFGNLAGSLFAAGIFGYYSGILSEAPYSTWVVAFANTKAVHPSWGEILVRGIACNYLVCVGVFHGFMATEVISKIVGIHLPIFLFVACGFDHVVANMLFIPLAMMLGSPITASYYVWHSFIPSWIGNALGGVFFVVPMLYMHMQDDFKKKLHDDEEDHSSAQSIDQKANGSIDHKVTVI